jgi:hypothetical protein
VATSERVVHHHGREGGGAGYEDVRPSASTACWAALTVTGDPVMHSAVPRNVGRLACRRSACDSGRVKVRRGSLQLEVRPRFAWGRGALAAGSVGLVLLVLNAQHRYEGIHMDDSPFADTWQFCERMEYGWPATGLAVPLSLEQCSILPDLSILGLMFDLCVAVISVGGLGLLAGGYQRRTFAELPSEDA